MPKGYRMGLDIALTRRFKSLRKRDALARVAELAVTIVTGSGSNLDGTAREARWRIPDE